MIFTLYIFIDAKLNIFMFLIRFIVILKKESKLFDLI
jgi:hypothetical protein